MSFGRYVRAFCFIHSGMPQMASAMLPTMAPSVSALAPLDVRPNFSILFYPVITMDEKSSHAGSVNNFLGTRKSNAETVRRFSPDQQVNHYATPPALVILSNDDRIVPPVTNASTYTVSVQDHGEVPIAGNHIEEYSAERGQGVVYRNYSTSGNIRVRQGPSTETSVIGIIRDEKGMTPDVFDCLGKENGWYNIRFGSKVAYVRCDLMEWDAINSF